MIRGTPFSRWRTARVSSRVRTTGRYCGRLARTTSSSHVHVEHLTIQKEQGAECLILGGGRDLVTHGQRGQECGDLGWAHVGGMPLVMEEDEPPDPVDVGFLGPPTVVPGADGLPDPVEEPGRV